MSQDEMKKHAEGLQQIDVEVYVQDKNAPTPWFALRKKVETEVESAAWYCALVPPALVSKLLERGCDWDFHMGDGIPSVWTIHQEGQLEQKIYCPYGNRDGIEPLVLSRTFHGLREPFIELSQEFRLFHNLYPDPKNNRFVHIDANGDESEAVRYGKDFLEVRTDLLQAFCNTKQMAVAVHVDSIRYSPHKLEELGLQELREIRGGEHFKYQYAIVPHDDHYAQAKPPEKSLYVAEGTHEFLDEEPSATPRSTPRTQFQPVSVSLLRACVPNATEATSKSLD